MLSGLQDLITAVSRLPGLGKRSSRRIVLFLLQNKELLLELSALLKKTANDVLNCSECGNIDIISPCSICTDIQRSNDILCIVESITDLWTLERSGLYKGVYHILGGTISAIDGRTPDMLNLGKLKERIQKREIKEVIIATNATLEGESTGYYLADFLMNIDIRVTRLAHGIPMGGSIDHMDDGTINVAFKLRQPLV